MPELPEVEVVRRGLEKILQHQPHLTEIQLHRPDLRDPIPVDLVKSLKGAQILAVDRRAKYLLFHTTKGFLLSHLGMTGTWRCLSSDEKLRKHDHVSLCFEGNLQLVYHDPRRFGYLDFAKDPTTHAKLIKLGPEPFDDAFSAEYLRQKIKSKKSTIKSAIMDQAIVVGVGNIYASEALFLAGIRPQKKAYLVSSLSCRMLVEKIRWVLAKAIESGGSSISDFKGADAQGGYFQTQFQVYDRKGLKCVRCRALIRETRIAGRSSFWCPRCQK